MKGAVSPITVLKSEDIGAWEKTALPNEAFLNWNKLREKGIPTYVITVKNGVDIIYAFFTRAPETVAVRKNNLVFLPFRSTPGSLQIFHWSGLLWQYFYSIFNT